MNNSSRLYMFAIVPPEQLSSEIDGVRKAFKEEFGFGKALKPPVHITLFPPFSLTFDTADRFEERILRLQNWTDHKLPFVVELSNFDFFDNPRNPVIYIDIVRNEALTELHRDFIRELGNYLEMEARKQSFHPHITIGYRDVTPAAFPEIKRRYALRKFKGAFTCDAIHLWRHTNGKWQTIRTFDLAGREEQLSLF